MKTDTKDKRILERDIVYSLYSPDKAPTVEDFEHPGTQIYWRTIPVIRAYLGWHTSLVEASWEGDGTEYTMGKLWYLLNGVVYSASALYTYLCAFYPLISDADCARMVSPFTSDQVSKIAEAMRNQEI